MTETLNVEFEVEETNDCEYGYQEKYLRFHGGNTRYKGIVKDGKLVAILGKNYKLITNETVDKAVRIISDLCGYRCESKHEGWKLFDSLWNYNGKEGVMVVNSVDGTVSLKCIAILNIKGHTGVLVGKNVKNINRRHTKKSVTTEEGLSEEIKVIMEESVRYSEWLGKMSFLKVKDNMEVLKVLFGKLPKDYVKGLEMMTTFKTFVEPTVKDVYEAISQKIWGADTKMVTKMTYYRTLNNLMFIIVGI
jgi:hypothetical protein